MPIYICLVAILIRSNNLNLQQHKKLQLLRRKISGLSAVGFHQGANDTGNVPQDARTEIHFTKRREREKKKSDGVSSIC